MNIPLSNQITEKISKLAALDISQEELPIYGNALSSALDIVTQLQTVDTTNVEPTSRIGQSHNRWREDEVDERRMFSQSEALANAAQTHQGYFVVERLIDHEA